VNLPESVPAALFEAAQRWGEAPALIEARGRRLSYAELGEEVVRTARAMVAFGIEPGDRVAVWAPNSVEWAIAALGALAAGGVLVPVNTRFKGKEAHYLLAKSKARALFTVRGFLGYDYPEMLASASADQPLDYLEEVVVFGEDTWDDFRQRASAVPADEVRRRTAALGSSDLSDVIFTSGTTGAPKGVMATHGRTLRVFATWAETVGLNRTDRYLVVNPFFHTFGYKAGLLASILVGASVYPMATLDVDLLMEIVEEERITVLPGPPTLYATILDHPARGAHDLSSLRLAVTGAANVPVELIRRMSDELGFETVLTAYGLTEATGTVTMCRRGDSDEVVSKTSGRAIPGTEVRVVDPDGNPLGPGQAGEVVVRGYNVMAGYFEDPDQTASVIDSEGWLHTGDIGVLDEAGNLSITDRMKDMFIVGGFNAYPAEIENTLMAHPSVSQVAVVGMPDSRLGEVGVAFVVARPNQATSEEELAAWAREQMANYKVPRRFVFVESLPVNASGKVLKNELRERAAALK